MTNPTQSTGRRAVVMGASFAGLTAARVLADHFAEVVILERDLLPDDIEPRSGVPQGKHIHVLLKRGEMILEQLFPGLRNALLENGAQPINWAKEIRWYHFGGWKKQHDLDFETIACTRLLIEREVRKRLLALPNVRIAEEMVVDAILTDENKSRVTGVRTSKRKSTEAPREWECDVLVDATGRESKMPEWLKALNMPVPEEKRVNSFLGYSSRIYRKPKDFNPGWKSMLIHPTPPKNSRLGMIFPIEGDRWFVTAVGVNKDYPPTDEAGFDDFLRNLASPEFFQAVQQCEPISPVSGHRRTENRLRRYDKLSRYLDGLVVLGDACAAFNPVYGQGISMAAVSATLLGESLQATARAGGHPGLSRNFQKRLGRALIIPWFLATSEDGRYSETEGYTLGRWAKVVQRYVDQLIRASVHNPQAYLAFIKVMHMIGSPAGILSPGVFARVMKHGGDGDGPSGDAPVTTRLRSFQPVT